MEAIMTNTTLTSDSFYLNEHTTDYASSLIVAKNSIRQGRYNNFTDQELSEFIQVLNQQVILSPKRLQKFETEDSNKLEQQTETDLSRLGLVVTDGNQLIWSSSSDDSIEDIISVNSVPSMVFAESHHLSLIDQLAFVLSSCSINQEYAAYFKRFLNQEVLFQSDQWLAMYRSKVMDLLPDNSENQKMKIRYCRQLKIIDKDRVDLLVHSYLMQDDKKHKISTSTIELGVNAFKKVQVLSVKHQFNPEQPKFFKNAKVRAKTLLSLVEKSGLAKTDNLLLLIQSIKELRDQADEYRLDPMTTTNQLQKADALDEVANHTTQYVLHKITRPKKVPRVKNQLKNCLKRHHKVLTKHQNIFWKIWNAIFGGVSQRNYIGASTNKFSFMPKAASTKSYGLAQQCFDRVNKPCVRV
jgi:hypothetical protein